MNENYTYKVLSETFGIYEPEGIAAALLEQMRSQLITLQTFVVDNIEESCARLTSESQINSVMLHLDLLDKLLKNK